MGVFDTLRSAWSGLKKEFNPTPKQKPKQQAQFTGYTNGQYRALFHWNYNGEKNLGEIGPIKFFAIDYEGLRLRSWQSYLESEVTQTIFKKYATWVVGKGLKLQVELMSEILKKAGIDVDAEGFAESAESRFKAFSKSIRSDYNRRRNLKYLGKKAFISSIVGGDVLVILRYEDECLNVQLVDASHIQSPVYGTEYFPYVLDNGNKVIYGIEMNDRGEHVAYYIRKPGFGLECTRVPAKGAESGLTMAFLVYGMEYRIDNTRGLPLIAVVLETLKKLERYKEATVGSAEERQKIVYQIKHGLGSTGESPLTKQLVKAHDVDAQINSELPTDQELNQLANTIATTTNKMTYNMPRDSELKEVQSKNELYFKDFYTVNVDLVCSSINMPPEVAMSKYNSNYSASRAALKDWENTLNVIREDFAEQFYQRIYNVWLEIEILKNNVKAPGYLAAILKDDYMILEAFRNARWVGAAVPHIDPMKEVQAERLKLGDTAVSIPLTTVEQAIEVLNGGDADNTMEQYAEEYEKSKSLKLVTPIPPVAPKAPGSPAEE